MSSHDQNHKPFLSGVLMQVVYTYRKHLTIIGLSAVILSAIFSGPVFITPLYKSIVILYPTASNSISKVLLSDNFNNSKDILEFGEIEQTEQMLQVLNSNKIRDRIIDKYDLLNHYGIKDKSKFKMTQLYDEYESNFAFRRTEFMAVKITVYDKDPKLAAFMANDVAELVDSIINQMQKKIARRAFNIVENEYLKLKLEIKNKEDSLTILREFGVHDYESQSEMFNRQLAIEMAEGNTNSISRLEKKLETLAKYGGPYVSLRDALEHDKKQLSQLKAKYEEAKVDAHESLPHTFVINTAYEAERKTYPIRWLIVVISTFTSLFLAIIILSLVDMFSGKLGDDIKKKSLVEDE
jgi:capsular polysaccharide biosynthesis protein